MQYRNLKKIKNKHSGFVILFAVTISSIILAVALGVANIAFREMKFGTSARDTNNAFLAADTGIEYALFSDKPPSTFCTPAPCVWNNVITGLGSGGQSCAKVSVDRTTEQTTILSKGYNIGDASCNSTNPDRIERELRVSYGSISAPPPPTPQCSDGVDNADPEDVLIDMADPGCSGVGDSDETDSATPWYSPWLYRKAITIDNTKVPGSSNLLSFPLLIDRTDANLASNAQTDGDDILFTSSDGTTKLSHEIETYSSGTGRLVAWVKVPTLSASADTVLYMYYGNSGATNQQNVTGTWDAGYKLVSHLPNGTTLSANDSTSNANNGTLVNTPTVTTGQVDGGASFASASSEYVADTSLTGAPNIEGPLTMSVWLKYSSAASRMIAFSAVRDDTAGASNSVDIELTGAGGRIGVFKWGAIELAGASAPSTNNWHYIVYTVGGSNNNSFYIDGGAPVTSTTATNTTAVGLYRLGSFNSAYPSPYWNGELDEARLSNVVRSSDWITTEYNNQSSPSTFYTVGSQEIP